MSDNVNHNPQPELSEQDAELLSAYLDKMLSPDEKRDLEARLGTDSFLRTELSAMRQTVAWMNALPTLKAPRDFTITAQDVAPAKLKIVPRQNRNLWIIGSAAAAVIVVVLGILAVFPLTETTSEQMAGESAEIALFVTEINFPGDTQSAEEGTLDTGADVLESDGTTFADGEALRTDNAQIQATQELARSESLSFIETTATAITQLFSGTENAPQLAPPAAQSQGQGGGALAVVSTPLMTQTALLSPAPTNAPVELESQDIAQSAGDDDTASTGLSLAEESEQDESANFDMADDIADQDTELPAPEPANLTETVSTTGIESRSAFREPQNLIQAFLFAMQDYFESRQP